MTNWRSSQRGSSVARHAHRGDRAVVADLARGRRAASSLDAADVRLVGRAVEVRVERPGRRRGRRAAGCSRSQAAISSASTQTAPSSTQDVNCAQRLLVVVRADAGVDSGSPSRARRRSGCRPRRAVGQQRAAVQAAAVEHRDLVVVAHDDQVDVADACRRRRNRIALQSDILGAYSLGIRNILCLSGDHQSFGSQPDALNVFDIDSMNLLRTVKDMRDEGGDMSGFALKEPP